MSLFQLLLAIAVSATAISASALPRVDANGVCEFDNANYRMLNDIIQTGDNLEAVAEMLEGCVRLSFNDHLQTLLRETIRLHRQASFEFMFSRIIFRTRGTNRTEVSCSLLRIALSVNNIQIADYILNQNFQIERVNGKTFWFADEGGAWKLEELKKLIVDHRAKAAALSPTNVCRHENSY